MNSVLHKAHSGTWTEDEVALMRSQYPHRLASDVASMLGRPVTSVYAKATKLGLQKRLAAGRIGRRGPRNRRVWSDADVAYLQEHFSNTRTIDVARALGRGYSTVCAKAKRLELRKSEAFLASEHSGRLCADDGRGLTGRFPKGNVPFNKGRHMPSRGRAIETQFRTGQLPPNTLPVGAYRINAEGYLEQKYAEQPGDPSKRWRTVHRLVWEAEHGPMPPGHVVVFRDGRRTTVLEEITLERVELVSQRDLMLRNSIHARLDPELVDLVRLKGVLTREINKQAKAKSE